MVEKAYTIRSAECGRDKDGVFHCRCGECTETNNESCPFVIKSKGIRAHVVKDGVDITKGIKAVHIDFKAGSLPEITVERVETEMEISICDCMYKEKQPNQEETTV